jgi:hypothetical protein
MDHVFIVGYSGIQENQTGTIIRLQLQQVFQTLENRAFIAK